MGTKLINIYMEHIKVIHTIHNIYHIILAKSQRKATKINIKGAKCMLHSGEKPHFCCQLNIHV